MQTGKRVFDSFWLFCCHLSGLRYLSFSVLMSLCYCATFSVLLASVLRLPFSLVCIRRQA